MRLNVRVKAEYERAIRETYGVIRPYAGVELERELSALVGDGRLAELFDAVHRLSDALGETAREKKTQTPPRSESVMCRYRIRETVRDDVMALAEETDVTYPRDLVERVMWDYAQDRSAVDKAVDRMGRIRDKAETELGASDSTTARRTLTIVNALTGESELGSQPGFQVEDFDAVVDEHVQGISSGTYARERYLPRVLDEMDYTWHPDGPVFVSQYEEFIPDDRDARSKPYVLMDRDDKREAIRRDAIETAAKKTSTKKAKYTVGDGVSALDGRPNRQTVEQLLRAIANDDDRIKWDTDDAVALVTAEPTTSGGAATGDVSAQLDQISNATAARENR